MTQTYYHFTAFVLIILVAFAAGCSDSGPKTYPVEGVITHNGEPVEGATVTFTAASATSAMARTGAGGKYTLVATSGAAGAEEGTYTVTISKKEAVPTGRKVPGIGPDGEDAMVDEMAVKELLPTAYGSAQNTPLKNIAVEAKKLNTHDFNLE